MSNIHHAADFRVLTITVSLVLGASYASSVFPQTTNIEHNYPAPLTTQNLTTQPSPAPSDLNKPPKGIHRIGTAIRAPRNSVSIKSTDAGVIRRQPSTSGCTNCGIIDSINKIGQAPAINAIANGIVAGTVAREIIRQTPHPHPQAINGNHNNHKENIVYPGNQYQVNMIMDDGRQAIIALPEGASFQQGDRVKWVDGTLILDRQ